MIGGLDVAPMDLTRAPTDLRRSVGRVAARGHDTRRRECLAWVRRT